MPKLDKFSQHEALHMSSFFARTVETELMSHPYIEANLAFHQLAEKAVDALNELYQAIGAKSAEDNAK